MGPILWRFLLLFIFLYFHEINGQDQKDFCPTVHKSIVCTCYGFDAAICNGNRSDEVSKPIWGIVQELHDWPGASVPILFIAIKNLRIISPKTFENLSIANLILPENDLKNLTTATFFGLENSLRELNLGGNNMTEIPDDALVDLKELRILKMLLNSITTITADQLNSIPQIYELDLSYNLINFIVPGAFEKMAELKTLNLANNLLHFLNSTTFSLVPNLNLIDLTQNRFKHLEPSWFKLIPQLTELHLGYNNITALDDVKISNQHLQLLALEHNQIKTCFSHGMIMKTPNLLALNAKSNMLEEIKPNCFGNLRNLKELYINNNMIGKLEPDSFVSLTNLRFLNITFNILKNFPKNSFNGCIKMKSILSDFNLLENIDPESGIAKMNNLASLSVKSCVFRKLEPKALPANAVLQNVFLEGNPLVCDCDMKRLLKYGSENKVIISGNCSMPHNMNSVNLQVVDLSSQNCEDPKPDPRVSARAPKIELLTRNATLDESKNVELNWSLENAGDYSSCKTEHWTKGTERVAQFFTCPAQSQGSQLTTLSDVQPGEVTVCFIMYKVQNGSENVTKCEVIFVSKSKFVEQENNLSIPESLPRPSSRKFISNYYIIPSFNSLMEGDHLIKVEWTSNNWTVNGNLVCKLTVQSHDDGIFLEIFNEVVDCKDGVKDVKVGEWETVERHFSICLDVYYNFVRQNYKCIQLIRQSDEFKRRNLKTRPYFIATLIAIGCVILLAILGLVVVRFAAGKKKVRDKNSQFLR